MLTPSEGERISQPHLRRETPERMKIGSVEDGRLDVTDFGCRQFRSKKKRKKKLDTPPGDGYIPIPAAGATVKSGLLFDNWKAGAGHSNDPLRIE